MSQYVYDSTHDVYNLTAPPCSPAMRGRAGAGTPMGVMTRVPGAIARYSDDLRERHGLPRSMTSKTDRPSAPPAPAAPAAPTEIMLADDIGTRDGIGMSAIDFASKIKRAKGPVSLIVNSGGGWISEMFAMRASIGQHRLDQNLRGHRVDVLVKYAFSAAAQLCLACSKITMASDGAMMFHWPSDAEGRPLKDSPGARYLVFALAKRTGLDEWRIRLRLDEQTWYTAREAKALNFIDAIVDDEAGLPSPSASRCILGAKNSPGELRKKARQVINDA